MVPKLLSLNHKNGWQLWFVPEDVDAFVAECNKENIDAVVVATVTEKPNLVMHWNGETIVDLERRFLDTNGVRVVVDAKVVDKDVKLPEERTTSADTLEADTLAVLSDLNHASQKACKPSLTARSVVQRSIHPLGGRYQLTPTEASVQKLPVQHGVTHTASVMAQGFNPYVAEWSPIPWCCLCGYRSDCSFGCCWCQTGLRLASLTKSISSVWTNKLSVLVSQ